MDLLEGLVGGIGLPCLSGRRELFTLFPLCLLALFLPPPFFTGMSCKLCRDPAEIRCSTDCLILNRSLVWAGVQHYLREAHFCKEPLQPAAKGWSLGRQKERESPTSHAHGKTHSVFYFPLVSQRPQASSSLFYFHLLAL